MELQQLIKQGMHVIMQIEEKIAVLNDTTKKESKADTIVRKEELLEALAKAREADLKYGLCSEPSRAAWELVVSKT